MVQNLFSFDGRVRRGDFWVILLGSAVIYGLIVLLAVVTFAMLPSAFYYFPMLVAVWIAAATGAKRCHDLGKSGWLQLLPFYIFWMLFADSEPRDNKYGADPKGRGGSDPNAFTNSRPDVLDSPIK